MVMVEGKVTRSPVLYGYTKFHDPGQSGDRIEEEGMSSALCTEYASTDGSLNDVSLSLYFWWMLAMFDLQSDIIWRKTTTAV